MKKLLFTLAFALSTMICFSQASPLTVYNSSPVPLMVKAGVGSSCSVTVGITPTVTINPGDFATFTPLGSATDFWFGLKAWDATSTSYGSFYNPCFGACGVDNSVNLNIQWDTTNGCYVLKLY